MTLNRKKSSAPPCDWQGDQLKLHVVFQKQGDSSWPISVKITVHQSPDRQILLSEIIWRLKEQSLNDYFDSSVSYFHQQRRTYIFGFVIPSEVREQEMLTGERFRRRIHESAFSSNQDESSNLRLRFRRKVGGRLELLKEEQRGRYVEGEAGEGRQVKQKEKSIAEVVEKVALWRKLYTGFLDERGEVVHMDLDSSATEIGIVKKTLDDYLLQIRNGKRYGFNFHKRRGEKIGELRSFVKEHKLEDDKAGRGRK